MSTDSGRTKCDSRHDETWDHTTRRRVQFDALPTDMHNQKHGEEREKVPAAQDSWACGAVAVSTCDPKKGVGVRKAWWLYKVPYVSQRS